MHGCMHWCMHAWFLLMVGMLHSLCPLAWTSEHLIIIPTPNHFHVFHKCFRAFLMLCIKFSCFIIVWGVWYTCDLYIPQRRWRGWGMCYQSKCPCPWTKIHFIFHLWHGFGTIMSHLVVEMLATMMLLWHVDSCWQQLKWILTCGAAWVYGLTCPRRPPLGNWKELSWNIQ